MKTEIAEVFMNPVRQRIIQYLLVHEKGTVKEIKKALPDVPSASLYRHIKILHLLLLSGKIKFAERWKMCIN